MLQFFPLQLATEFLETASHQLQEKGNHQEEASVLYVLGTLALNQNQPEKAIELLQRSRVASQVANTPQMKAKVLLKLGQAYNLRQSNNDSEGFSPIEAHLQLAAILSQIGAAYTQQNYTDKAIHYLEQSVEVREWVREQLQDADAESLRDYVNSSAKDYQLLATLLQQQGKSQEALEILNLLNGKHPLPQPQKSQDVQEALAPQTLQAEVQPKEVQSESEPQPILEDSEPQKSQPEEAPVQLSEDSQAVQDAQARDDVNGQVHPKKQLRVLIDQTVADKPTAPEFAQRLEEAGVQAKVKLTTTGRISGLSYLIDNHHYYGYRLGKEYTWDNLQKRGVRYNIKRDLAQLEPYRLLVAERNSTNSEPVETLQVENLEPVEQPQTEEPPVNDADSTEATRLKLQDLFPTTPSKPKFKPKATSTTTRKKPKTTSSKGSEQSKPETPPTQKEPVELPNIPPKKYLQDLIERAIADQATAPQLAQRLADAGVEVRASVMKNGHVKGLSFQLNGEHFYGSRLGQAYSWPSLLQRGLTYEPKRDQAELEKYSLAFDRRSGQRPSPAKHFSKIP